MKKWKRTLMILSGVLLGAGALLTAAGWLKGGSLHYRILLPGGYQKLSTDASAPRRITDLGAFTALSLQADNVDVTICGTAEDAAYLETTLPEDELTYTLTDGVLSISAGAAEDRLEIAIGPNEIGGGETLEGALTLYLPEKSMPKDITLSSDYGDVALSSLTCEKISLSLACGDLTLKDLVSDQLTLASEYGDAALSSLTCSDLSLELDCGDTEIDQLSSGTLSLTASYGDLAMTAASLKSGTLALECGDAKLDELSVSQELSLSSDYGDIRVSTSEGADTYSLQAQTNFGDIRCGLPSVGDSETSSVNVPLENAPRLQLSAQSGDIIIE